MVARQPKAVFVLVLIWNSKQGLLRNLQLSTEAFGTILYCSSFPGNLVYNSMCEKKSSVGETENNHIYDWDFKELNYLKAGVSVLFSDRTVHRNVNS